MSVNPALRWELINISLKLYVNSPFNFYEYLYKYSIEEHDLDNFFFVALLKTQTLTLYVRMTKKTVKSY